MSENKIAFGCPDESDSDPKRVTDFLARLDATAKVALEQNLDDRDGFQDRLYRDYGHGLDSMDLFYFSALEAAAWARGAVSEANSGEGAEEDFDVYYEVVRGLAARALAAYSETAWLLRGGFPNGALTRVRLLHELAVTAGVFARYGMPQGPHPELVERYLAHRDVFTPGTADDLISTGVFEQDEIITDDVLKTLGQRRKDLLTRYGGSFGGMWGWAGPLFPDKSRISMKMMGSLVWPEGYYFYGMTSAHVHAGSEGWHDTPVVREHETQLASGSTNVGLALPAQLASAHLLEVVQVVLPYRVEREDGVDDTGAQFHAGLARMNKSISEAMWRGETNVEQAETEFQERVRQRTAETAPLSPRVRGRALWLVHRVERGLRRGL